MSRLKDTLNQIDEMRRKRDEPAPTIPPSAHDVMIRARTRFILTSIYRGMDTNGTLTEWLDWVAPPLTHNISQQASAHLRRA